MKFGRTATLDSPAVETATPADARPVLRFLGAAPLDLLLTVAAAVGAAATVLGDGPTAARVLLGVPLALFLPGYALASALFPGADTIDGAERVALGFALSVATIPLAALVLDRSRWSIARDPVTVSLLLITALASAVAAYRRAVCPEPQRFAPRLGLPGSPPWGWDRSTLAWVGLLALAGVFLVAGGAFAVNERLAGQPLTEIALYSADGRPAFFPRQLVAGEPATVRLSITNREGRAGAYVIALGGAGRAVGPLPSVVLADDKTWDAPIEFTVAEVGPAQAVTFDLWRSDARSEGTPYRSLRLVVDVVAPSGSDARGSS